MRRNADADKRGGGHLHRRADLPLGTKRPIRTREAVKLVVHRARQMLGFEPD